MNPIQAVTTASPSVSSARTWHQPLLASCGCTVEAATFHDKVLRAGPQDVQCDGCRVAIAPWAPRNWALWAPDASLPPRYKPIARYPDANQYMTMALYDRFGTGKYTHNRQRRVHLLATTGSRSRGHSRHAPKPRPGQIRLRRSSRRCARSRPRTGNRRKACLDPAHVVASASSPRPQRQEAFAFDAPVPRRSGAMHPRHAIANIMFQPVSLSCGHTFDRYNILKGRSSKQMSGVSRRGLGLALQQQRGRSPLHRRGRQESVELQ